jgi:uncharacterized protein (DUF1330 family)
MSAYFVARLIIKDEARYEDYLAGGDETFASSGAEVVAVMTQPSPSWQGAARPLRPHPLPRRSVPPAPV